MVPKFQEKNSKQLIDLELDDEKRIKATNMQVITTNDEVNGLNKLNNLCERY